MLNISQTIFNGDFMTIDTALNIDMINSNHLKNDLQGLFSNKIKPFFDAFRPQKNSLDLNSMLAGNPEQSFLIRVAGDSMIGAGINNNDTLLVDSAALPEDGKIVVAQINNKLAVKRLKYYGTELYLISENDKYSPIRIYPEDEFFVWGVVKSVIKHM